jgi:hypothetical protein
MRILHAENMANQLRVLEIALIPIKLVHLRKNGENYFSLDAIDAIHEEDDYDIMVTSQDCTRVNKEDKYKFFTFLEKNGVLRSFIENVITGGNTAPDTLRVPSLITGAFKWVDTPEGHDFWINIHGKWIQSL